MLLLPIIFGALLAFGILIGLPLAILGSIFKSMHNTRIGCGGYFAIALAIGAWFPLVYVVLDVML